MSTDQVRIKHTTIERGVRIGRSAEDGMAASKALVIAAVKQKRDHEKMALHQLNDRFAKYIERVKFLEGQNKKLLAELDELRQRWGEESRQLRLQYDPDLLNARVIIDDTTSLKALAEIRAKRCEYDAMNLKRQYDEAVSLIQADKNKMANLEYLWQENQTELDLLRRQMNDAESDIEKYKKEIVRLNADLKNLLIDLDQETLKRVKLENEKQTLEEQIPFLNAIHEQEMAELRSLQAGLNIDPAQFYRHELERAIRDIRSDFEELSETQKRELEEWYRIKTEEIAQEAARREALDSLLQTKVESTSGLRSSFQDGQNEFNNLKQINAELVMRLGKLEEMLDSVRRNNGYTLDEREREIASLRARLQELMADYDELMNNKASLEFEITTYRRLLESEETRVSRPMQIPTTSTSSSTQRTSTTTHTLISSSTHSRQRSSSPPRRVEPEPPVAYRNEMSSKTTFQRSAKGPISISECSPDGKVIILENTSRNKDVHLQNWILKRRVDSNDEILYRFPPQLELKANSVVRIWSRGHGRENAASGDLVNHNIDNWGMGMNIVTIILDDVGDEKATHLQKTIYT